MLRNKIYYALKPFIPQSLRLVIRGWWSRRLRENVGKIWPVLEGSERHPENWPGWPGGKKFAFVLTHDVEGQLGLDNCRQLMELEKEAGFYSSFNFIPEGEYMVSCEFREELQANGFEVGVHDLQHDGRLYRSREEFSKKAGLINGYLKDWGAVGFRSGFMLHKLDWLHDLNIRYDASTFDTDPFEPQPEGRHTIFPFWVSSLDSDSSEASKSTGYVELPYTLPQDSTLYLILREKTPEIWMRKLDWVAKHGGMALVNIHPDYINFNGGNDSRATFPASHVRELLDYVSTKYAREYWNPLPKDLAAWFVTHRERHLNSAAADEVESVFAAKLKGRRAAVLLYSYYPSDPRPRREAEALASVGVEVDLFCLREKDDEPQEEVINGVNVFRFPLRKKRDSKLTYFFQYGSFLIRCFLALAKRCFKKHYDLVHVHNMPDILVFSALPPKLKGARIILDLHDPMPELMTSIYNIPENHFLVRLLRRFEKWSIGFADLVLTPNKAFVDLFVSRSCKSDKIETIMNSPQNEIFDIVKYPPRSTTGSYRMMYHGLIAARHGLDTALHAITQLRSAIPGVEFHIYGGRTAYMDEMDVLIQKLNLGDCVHYHGNQPQTEIARAISTMDIGLIPNRRSPFTEINMPTRIFEYIAMGKPVVTPNTVGIRDYFDENSTFYFEPDSPESLAAVILRAFQSPVHVAEVVAKGRKIYEVHRWEIQRRRLLEVVSRLVSPKD